MIFQYHIQYPYGPQCVISVQKNPWISFKIPDIMDPISTIEVHIVSFLSKTAPKLHAKEYQISGTLSAQETGYRAASRDIYCCLSVSHTSLDIMMSRAAYDSSLYKTLMVHTMSFLPKTTIKFHAKCHISGTLWLWKMGCCAVKMYIHCCLKISDVMHPLSTGNVMLCCKVSHPLSLERFITYLH